MFKVLLLVSSLSFVGLLLAAGPADFVKIDIPRTQNSPQNMGSSELEIEQKMGKQIVINFSSWTPKQFETSSQLPNTTRFSKGSFTSLAATLDIPLAESFLLKRGRLMGAFGFGLDEFNRSGIVVFNSIATKEEQTVYMASLRAGFEYFYDLPRVTWMSSYVQLFALPSLTFSHHSSFGDGASGSGLPLEYGIGGAFSLASFGKSLSDAWFNLGFIGRTGKVAGGRIDGTGWILGARMGL